jgi:uncharacterized protein (DUF362 family)
MIPSLNAQLLKYKEETFVTDINMKTDVHLLVTEDRIDGVEKLLNYADTPEFLDKTILVKPNFNSADPNPGSTHLDTVRTLISFIQSQGAGRIIVGDRSGMGDTRAAMTEIGVFDLAEEMEFEVMVFEELLERDWEYVKLQDGHWKKGFAIPRILTEVDVIVQTCCLKTHKFGRHFTMSLKNSVGLVAKKVPGDKRDYMHELHLSRSQRKMIAEINTAYETDLILLDGIQAFTHGGPAKGTLVSPNVILVGQDRVAIDAIGVAILRKHGTTRKVSKGSIFSHPQIARAAELGVGVNSPEQIRIVTHDEKSEQLAEEITEILRA